MQDADYVEEWVRCLQESKQFLDARQVAPQPETTAFSIDEPVSEPIGRACEAEPSGQAWEAEHIGSNVNDESDDEAEVKH